MSNSRIEELMRLSKNLTPGKWSKDAQNRIFTAGKDYSGYVCSIASKKDTEVIELLPELLKELIEYHFLVVN